jgi:hypothetical protein
VYYVDVNARNTKETVIFAASTAVENEYTYISGLTYAAGVSGTKTGRFTAMLTVPAGANTLLINQYGSPASYTAYCHKVEQKTDSTLTQSNVAAEAAAVGAQLTTIGGQVTALDTRMTAAEKNLSDLTGVVYGDETDVDMITDALDLEPVGTAVEIGTKAHGYWKYTEGEPAECIEQESGNWYYWPKLTLTDAMKGARMMVQGLRYGGSGSTSPSARPVLFTDANDNVIKAVESKGAATKDYRFTVPKNAVYMLLTTYRDTNPQGVWVLTGFSTGKKPYATGNIFFTVDCPRPLPFGESEYTAQTTETVECVLRLPSTYTPEGTPTRLVLACHGKEGYIEASSNTWYNSNWIGLMNALTAAGYAVFDANIFAKDPTLHPDWNYDDPSSDSYYTNFIGYALGSPLYVQALKRAYDYIVANYNVYPQIFAHGTSMGGIGAKYFTHVYPELVLAQSSFAGRDICRLLYDLKRYQTIRSGQYAGPYGYASGPDLLTDKFSHCAGMSDSFSLSRIDTVAINDTPHKVVTPPPDRETEFTDWLTYFAALASMTQAEAATAEYIGRNAVPYKAWNAWDDNVGYTAQEVIMQKAYERGGGAPYEIVNYNTGDAETAHTQMSYGLYGLNTGIDMRAQLVAWYKRWE